MKNNQNIQCVVETNAIVGESPTWCERKKKLYWVDIVGKKIHCYNPSNKQNDTFDLPDLVTAIALCEDDNKVVLSLRKTVGLYDLQTRVLDILITVETEQPNNRFNDAKCDPQGRLWAGTMNNSSFSSPDGVLYLLTSGKHCDNMMSGVACANGAGWSPDNKTMYFTDTFHYTVFAFDYDSETGNISNRRPFIVLDPKGPAVPDGLTVDAQGFIWSAHPGIGQIVRFDPAGKQERVVQLPVPRTTSCAFGGEDMKTLFVTSATELMTSAEIIAAPLSGSLFAIETDVVGLPTHRIPAKFYENC